MKLRTLAAGGQDYAYASIDNQKAPVRGRLILTPSAGRASPGARRETAWARSSGCNLSDAIVLAAVPGLGDPLPSP